MIEIKNLNMTFNPNSQKEFKALKNINLSIKKNSLTIIKGVSGSGKSTLLSLISALLKPTNGEIIVDAHNIAKLPEHHASKFRAENIGFIFQSFNLFDSLSVSENISLALIPLGFNPSEISKKTQKAMKLANIDHKANQNVNNLSGGEKQRCTIARALVNEPKIILCDEPTANLDEANSLKFIQTLKMLKNLDKTLIVATHDPLFEKISFADKIVNIKDGEII